MSHATADPMLSDRHWNTCRDWSSSWKGPSRKANKTNKADKAQICSRARTRTTSNDETTSNDKLCKDFAKIVKVPRRAHHRPSGSVLGERHTRLSPAPELQNSNSTLALPSLICLICAKHCKIQIQCNTFTIFQYLPYLPWCLATFCVSLLRIRQNLSWSTRFNEHPEMTSEIKEPNCGQLRFEGRKLVSEWLTE
jgi:hypothetical protein